jgi:hypothetical protein
VKPSSKSAGSMSMIVRAHIVTNISGSPGIPVVGHEVLRGQM